MKKIAKHFDVSNLLIIIPIALFAFSITSCPDQGGGNGNGNINDGKSTSAFLGNNLALSDQVYLEKWNEDETSVRYFNFYGNLAIINDYGGSGNINGGKLNYSIGVPTGLRTLNFENFSYVFDNFTSSGNVRGIILDSLPINSMDYSDLYRDNTTAIMRSSSYSETYEQVVYVYVENDVTLKGTGWKEGPITETEIEDGITYTYTFTFTLGNLDLALKAGWNALYTKDVSTITVSGTTRFNITETSNISMGNPSNLKWTLIDFDSEYYSLTLDERNVLKAGNFPTKSLRQMRQNRLLSIQK